MYKPLLSLCLVGAALLAQDPEKKGPQMPEVGKPAPTFRVNNHSGVATPVGASENWTLLAFFPKAATPG